MARLDICNDDLSGVYLDGKWMDVESIDVHVYQHSAEFVYEMSGRRFETVPERNEYTVRLGLPSSGPILEMTFEDPEVFFWKSRTTYANENEMYVIQEMEP